MVSVDWLETFWQSAEPDGPGGKGFSFCGVTLDSIRVEKNNEKVVQEKREASNSRSLPDKRDEYYDEDASVGLGSDVSVLSIDYDNNEIAGHIKEKVDLSDIGDDESTVASFAPVKDIDEKAEVQALKENMYKVQSKNSSHSLGRNRSGILTKTQKIESSRVTGDPVAEQRRKELLIQLRNNIATHGRYSLEVANMVTRLAEFHESVNQPEMSVTLNIEAMNIYSSKLGDHDEKVTNTQIKLGTLKEQLGELDDALDYYCRALSMISAMSGIYEEGASNVRLRVAKIYQLKGFSKESVKELKKSLRSYRDIYGDEHITVANTVDQIADVYTQGGNHDKANSVRGELVKLKVALHGSKCSEVAFALTKWAATYIAIRDYQGALKVMKQAYVMYHEVEGPEAQTTESTLEQIGYLYSQTGREEKAIKAHTSVAVMRKMRHGEDSVEVAISYLILGKSFLKCTQYDKSMKSFNRAMTIFGKENEAKDTQLENLMDTLHHIGLVQKTTGKPSQALKAFMKELSIRKKMIPDDRQSIATTLAVTGATYFDLKKYEQANQHFIDALSELDRSEGRRTKFADVLYSCGEVQKKMNHPISSTCFLEAVQIYKANGCGESDKCMQHMMKQVKLSHGRDIQPSLKCTILDETKKVEI